MPDTVAPPFDLDALVEELKQASRGPDPKGDVRRILERVFAEPESVAANMPDFEKDDLILFEDDAVSIWFVRFQPGDPVPPHDHRIPVFIGVYDGVERNSLWRASDSGGIEVSSVHELGPGDVFAIGPSGIHSVVCGSPQPSLAIHVYLGNLTETKRTLFDPITGEGTVLTDAALDQLKAKPGIVEGLL